MKSPMFFVFVTTCFLISCGNASIPIKSGGQLTVNPEIIKTEPSKTPAPTVKPTHIPTLTPTVTSTPSQTPTPTNTLPPSMTPSPTLDPDLPWNLSVRSSNHDNIDNLSTLQEWSIDDPNINFIRHLAVSPNNSLLAAHVNSWAMNLGTELKIWNISNQEMVYEVREGSNYISDMEFSPDGTCFAIGSWGYYVKIWETERWRPIVQLDPKGEVNSIAFSPDGKYLIVGSNIGPYYEVSYRCSLSVWETQNWTKVREEFFQKDSCIIRNLVISHDSTKVAYTLSKPSQVQVRNIDDLQLIAEIKESVTSSIIDFS